MQETWRTFQLNKEEFNNVQKAWYENFKAFNQGKIIYFSRDNVLVTNLSWPDLKRLFRAAHVDFLQLRRKNLTVVPQYARIK